MPTIKPGSLPTAQFHSYLLGAVSPRPIAFVSTIDRKGNVNLSPFSFFNVFGSNPPTLIFAPARRVRDNTTKHSHENVMEVPEVTVNIVSYDMVQQMSLASTEYPKGVNEFQKSGFTPIPSEKVLPPRVKESKVSFECKVKQVIETGTEGGAGNLIICEILLMHLADEILNTQGQIDPYKLDAVGRLGGDWYVRVNGNAIFEVEKPVRNMGIGVDQLPESIRNSTVLTGNDLGKLGNVENLPSNEDILDMRSDLRIQQIFKENESNNESKKHALHSLAHQLLEDNKVMDAWKVLMLQ